ncbi:SWI/SNF-related matrix-associated actin-dependent regulator of chromatin subfamily A-like protein 1 [Danaus plexippus]|uniref:SWI/SNF-related matrix-associated actin-dependent regulator of chromatin subfamily A-like protein 1 n=1 Tax=Danaus plexippus TaxID=13037 RepID=UPI002AB1672F|nr:SWI/SNF-related matrix-associated actin-dependent regulator of chromatin subfamily A-like protein 1 [Danaus plexippus]
MECTKEQIEQKRLAALQKRLAKNNNHVPHAPQCPKPSDQPEHLKQGQSKNNSAHTFHPYSRPNSSKQFTTAVPVSNVVTGSVYLISEDRFEVNMSEFCPPLINIFKTLRSRSYDSNTKLWNFLMSDYENLMSKVTPLAPHIVIGPLPAFVLKILNDPPIDHSAVDLTPIEATLRNKLLPFQEEGVRFGIARKGRCLIADDMGLGKTFQALAIASYYRHDWPLLIVTTSSMRETWQNKISELLPSVPLVNVATLTSNKDVNFVSDRQVEVVIVSYKIISLHTELLRQKRFGFVIVDESHHLKSPKAQCTSALFRLCGQGRAVLLSGTPALSRPVELYTQLSLLEPRLFTYTEYGKRYCDAKQTNFGWDMTGKSNLAELLVILQRRFLIRRTKEQVLNLEEKTRETVILDQSLLNYSKEDQHGLTQMAEKFRNSKSSERHVAMIQYFNESAAIKTPAVCKYIRQLLSGSQKFLVFAHHKNVIDSICDTLDEQRKNYIRIVGSTPTHIRTELVDKFQHSESCRCAVLSITAANSGLTLTAADLVIFAELHWNPGILIQAESRAHRLGRAGSVCVRYLLARGTADDHMWPLLQTKLNVLNDVGLSGDNFEDTKMKHQDTKNNITQYMSPVRNKNDYIQGTNIKKISQEQTENVKSQSDSQTTLHGISKLTLLSPEKNSSDLTTDGVDSDDRFLENDEDDEILASIDLDM